MSDALIGYTGFVGQALMRHRIFDAYYNSANIEQIEGRKFDRIFCAGVKADKWWANANPSFDLENIERLKKSLDRVDAERVVLLSTVDVYSSPRLVTEADPVFSKTAHPYGAHRAMFEAWISRRFVCHNIIRLPALFGIGLKKNALFDLVNRRRIEFINPDSIYQWYPIDSLANDIERICATNTNVMNLVTEPIDINTIQKRLFPDVMLSDNSRAVSYDVRTLYADVFGKQGIYVLNREAVISELYNFVSLVSGRW